MWLTDSAELTGTVNGLPAPQLLDAQCVKNGDAIWTGEHGRTALLLVRQNRFAFVWNRPTPEVAMDHAEDLLSGDSSETSRNQLESREKVQALFSVNPRHNPPVALAAEALKGRLRSRTPFIHGLWSTAGGFESETLSLNELYPLTRAWALIDPPTAIQLVQTAISLQQQNGGFPAWIEAGGRCSTGAAWPLIIQSFELAVQQVHATDILKKTLPALRKYIQWALRHFDPMRDRIPAWQSEQEAFVPGTFERSKATPELTVMLIAELDALIRLSEELDTSANIETLREDRDQLVKTLYEVFWNPETRSFSNVWKNGHYLQESSFASFIPLFWKDLDTDRQHALVEAFEETRGFPGHRNPASWKHDQIDDTSHLPVIHQFIAFEALRTYSGSRSPAMLFMRRMRESFAAWFEHESIEAARGNTSRPAYGLGPVTAALIITIQFEFEQAVSLTPSTAQHLRKIAHRLHVSKGDMGIVAVFAAAALIAHMAYRLNTKADETAQTAEALLRYQQGDYTDAFKICRRFPKSALSKFIRANLMMLAERPEEAYTLYREALLKETESPSALFGLALSLHMTGRLDDAQKRYQDFLDIHGSLQPEATELAEEFMLLAREGFQTPPRWRRVFILPMMNDMGL